MRLWDIGTYKKSASSKAYSVLWLCKRARSSHRNVLALLLNVNVWKGSRLFPFLTKLVAAPKRLISSFMAALYNQVSSMWERLKILEIEMVTVHAFYNSKDALVPRSYLSNPDISVMSLDRHRCQEVSRVAFPTVSVIWIATNFLCDTFSKEMSKFKTFFTRSANLVSRRTIPVILFASWLAWRLQSRWLLPCFLK